MHASFQANVSLLPKISKLHSPAKRFLEIYQIFFSCFQKVTCSMAIVKEAAVADLRPCVEMAPAAMASNV
jgi:hypothetical protein